VLPSACFSLTDQTCRNQQKHAFFHTSSFQCDAVATTLTADAKETPDAAAQSATESHKNEQATNSTEALADKAQAVRLPPLSKISRSSEHDSLLSSAQEKMQNTTKRYFFMRNDVIPVREKYFSAASHFAHNPNSPAKRMKGVVPDYTSYFPAAVKKYDKTGMALTEEQVHKKFQKWWLATTGRGPPPKGQEKDKKKKRRK